MSNDNLKHKAVSGVIWSGISRFSVQGLAFIFNMIIARQLMPEAYGVVAIFTIFLSIADVFIDSGFGNALMRKKDRTEDDISTVFYFNTVIATLCYLIIFACAPVISHFYEMPELTKILRVIGLTLIFNALGTIQNTILTIRIDFKLKTHIALIGSVLTGAVGTIMVYKGFGVWTLVLQQLFNSFIGCALNWIYVHWMPKLRFSWKSFKELFSYGSKLLITALINSIYGNLSNIIVGKVYSATDLGEYSKARSLSNFPSNNINGIIMSVSFPVLVSIQDQKERLDNYYKKIINLSSFIIFPIMIGLAAVADPLIRLILTDKWEGIILLFQISCIAAMWTPIHSVNLNLLQVLGRSDFFLKLEIVKKIIGLLVLIITIPIGITAMCIGGVIQSLIFLFINTYYTKELMGYGIKEQLEGMAHILVHSMIMGLIAYFITTMIGNNLWRLICGSLAGMAYYFSASYLFKFPEMDELISIVKEQFS